MDLSIERKEKKAKFQCVQRSKVMAEGVVRAGRAGMGCLVSSDINGPSLTEYNSGAITVIIPPR